jgi:hypothetical protein
VDSEILLGKKNMSKVQRWRNEFGTPPSACVTVAQLHDKFRVDGTVQNVDKEHTEDLTVQLTMEAWR